MKDLQTIRLDISENNLDSNEIITLLDPLKK